MANFEEVLSEFRNGTKIRLKRWEKGEYIYLEDRKIYDEKGDEVCISNAIIIDSDWELYEEPTDWDYIIKNKCLCWFWDVREDRKKVAGYLADYDSYEEEFSLYSGERIAATVFDCCRPVRRGEVNFYEDKENVNR